MKNAFVVAVALLTFASMSFAGSILCPFWQDDATPIYSFLVVHNTSQTTSDDVDVMFYGKTGNAQAGSPIEKTIPEKNIEMFGTNHSGMTLNQPTGDPFGYAIVSGTEGMLIAVGIVYDANAHSGYPIPCFGGGDDLGATGGW
mgnify:CR=1 FL=1